MDDKILAAMASDMNITKYKTESESQYCTRILYYAVACWIKTAATDKVLGSDENSGVSRRHIIDRCVPILNELLLRHPLSKQWFMPEADAENPVSLIRTRLIRHGDLLNVGFNTNLILANQAIVPLNESVAAYKGVLLNPQTYYSGIATLGNLVSAYTSSSQIIDAVSWFNEYINSAWWEKVNGFDESTQFYNASCTSRNNYSCWQSIMPASAKDIVFARRTVNNAGYEYFLIRLKYGNYYIHRIDPFLQEIGEHRRFMFALRSLSENKIPCQITVHSDHISLKMWVRLPQKELTLLESYAWPHNSISDVLEWDMELSVWSITRPFFEALGFKIMEA